MYKKTKNLQAMLNELSVIAHYTFDESMGDNDFVAIINAINSLSNLTEYMQGDGTELRERIPSIYDELCKRIKSKNDIQQCSELIRALHQLIYGRSIVEEARYAHSYRKTLYEMSLDFVVSYRKLPIASYADYVYNLLYYGNNCHNADTLKSANLEVKNIINRKLKCINTDNTPEDLMHLVVSRNEISKYFVYNDYQSEWTLLMDNLISSVDVKKLSDDNLLLWMRALDVITHWGIAFNVEVDHVLAEAIDELSHRNSLACRVVYLSHKAWKELHEISAIDRESEIKLWGNSLDDNFLSDVLTVNINENLSTEELLALHYIYCYRYESLSFVVDERAEQVKSYCTYCLKEIYTILTKRMVHTEDIYLKVSILDAAVRMADCNYAIIDMSRDSRAFIDRNIDCLISKSSQISEEVLFRLIALKYTERNTCEISDNLHDKLASWVDDIYSKHFSGEMVINVRLFNTLTSIITSFRLKKYNHFASQIFKQLAKEAIQERNVKSILCLAELSEIYWYEDCAVEVISLSEAISTFELTATEQLQALVIKKFIESRCEIDILTAVS